MKKITSFLMLLLLCVGTSWGQGNLVFTPSDAPVDGQWAKNTHWYKINCFDGENWEYQYYLRSDKTQALGEAGSSRSSIYGLSLDSETQVDPGPIDAALWCMVPTEDGGYQFYNKATGTEQVLTFVVGVLKNETPNYGTQQGQTNPYDGPNCYGAMAGKDYVNANCVSYSNTFFYTRTDNHKPNSASFRLTSTGNEYWNRKWSYQVYYPNWGVKGYHISIWNSNNAANGGDKGSTYQFTEVILAPEVTTHAVNITVEGSEQGSFSLTGYENAQNVKTFTQDIEEGTVLKLTPAPVEGMNIAVYSGEQLLEPAPFESYYELTVNAPLTVKVKYTLPQFNVYFNNVTGNGTVEVLNGTETVSDGAAVAEGTALTLKVAPEAGWKTSSVTIAGTPQTLTENGEYPFNVNGPTNIAVVFVEDKPAVPQVKLSWTVEGEGTVQVRYKNGDAIASTPTTVDKDADIEFVCTAADGYSFTYFGNESSNWITTMVQGNVGTVNMFMDRAMVIKFTKDDAPVVPTKTVRFMKSSRGNGNGTISASVKRPSASEYVPFKSGDAIEEGSSIQVTCVPEVGSKVGSLKVRTFVDLGTDSRYQDGVFTFDLDPQVFVDPNVMIEVKFMQANAQVTFDTPAETDGTLEVKQEAGEAGWSPVLSYDMIQVGKKLQVTATAAEGKELASLSINGVVEGAVSGTPVEYIVKASDEAEGVKIAATFKAKEVKPVTCTVKVTLNGAKDERLTGGMAPAGSTGMDAVKTEDYMDWATTHTFTNRKVGEVVIFNYSPYDANRVASVMDGETDLTAAAKAAWENGGFFAYEVKGNVDIVVTLADPVVKHEVKFAHIGNGTVTLANGTENLVSGTEVEAGTELTLTVKADEGWKVASVFFGENDRVAELSAEGTLTFKVEAATNIAITFEEEVVTPEPTPAGNWAVVVPKHKASSYDYNGGYTKAEYYRFQFDDAVLGTHTHDQDNVDDNRQRTITMSAWLKVDVAPSSNAQIMGNTQRKFFHELGAFAVLVNKDGTLSIKPRAWRSGGVCSGIKGEVVTSTDKLTFGEWVFVSVSTDDAAKMIYLYLNGKKVAEADLSQDQDGFACNGIGYLADDCVFFAGTNSDDYSAYVDEVQLWTKKLSDKELKESMSADYSKNAPAELAAYYVVDEHSTGEIPNLGKAGDYKAGVYKAATYNSQDCRNWVSYEVTPVAGHTDVVAPEPEPEVKEAAVTFEAPAMTDGTLTVEKSVAVATGTNWEAIESGAKVAVGSKIQVTVAPADKKELKSLTIAGENKTELAKAGPVEFEVTEAHVASGIEVVVEFQDEPKSVQVTFTAPVATDGTLKLETKAEGQTEWTELTTSPAKVFVPTTLRVTATAAEGKELKSLKIAGTDYTSQAKENNGVFEKELTALMAMMAGNVEVSVEFQDKVVEPTGFTVNLSMVGNKGESFAGGTGPAVPAQPELPLMPDKWIEQQPTSWTSTGEASGRLLFLSLNDYHAEDGRLVSVIINGTEDVTEECKALWSEFKNYTHAIDKDLNVVVTFADPKPAKPKVTLSKVGTGFVSLKPAVGAGIALDTETEVEAGSQYNLIAYPNDSKNEVKSVTINGKPLDGVKAGDPMVNTYLTFNEDTKIVVTFGKVGVDPEPANGKVTLSVVGKGNVELKNGEEVLNADQEYQIALGTELKMSLNTTTESELQLPIVKVNGEKVSGSNGVYTIKVAAETNIVVYFVDPDAKPKHNVTLEVVNPEGGKVAVTKGEEALTLPAVVEEGTVLHFTVTPESNFDLFAFTAGETNLKDQLVDGAVDFTVNADTDFRIEFKKQGIAYSLPGGSVDSQANTRVYETSGKYDRKINSFTFDGGTKDGQSTKKEYTVQNSSETKKVVYHECSSEVFEASVGDKINVSFTKDMEWLHQYLYIDYNQDGMYTENELVAYTYYQDPDDESDQGDARGGRLNAFPEFEIPADAKVGETLMRFKSDWNSKDPNGNEGKTIGGEYGYIYDFTLSILAKGETQPTAPVLTYESTVTGGKVNVEKRGAQTMTGGYSWTAVTSGTELAAEDVLRITLTPEEGYEVESLNINDQAQTPSTESETGVKYYEYTVGATDAAVNVVPAFKATAPVVTKYNVRFSGSSLLGTLEVRNKETQDKLYEAFDNKVAEGTVLTISYSAAENCGLLHCYVYGEDVVYDFVDGTYDVTVNGDLTIEAEFAEVVTVTLSATPAEDVELFALTVEDEVDVFSGDFVKKGSEIMIGWTTIDPYAEFHMVSLTVNDVDVTSEVSESNIYTTVADKDLTVVGVFAAGPATGIAQQIAERVHYDANADVLNVPAEAVVSLYNVTGAKVAEVEGSVDMAAMTEGLYLAKVSMNGTTVVVKVIK